ncbi:MAG TPA: hypothetical protein VGF12_13705 [Roseateles sp.]|uniref:hypothetical protein n=1 Tax=Roseateles sp. TaxID=1971397 RepID=UPI002EDB8B25
MKDLARTLTLLMPPAWLSLALAAALAGALLVAFIDTLHENVRHGEEMRQGQRVGAVRQAIGTVANAVPGAPAQQLGTSISPSFQR